MQFERLLQCCFISEKSKHNIWLGETPHTVGSNLAAERTAPFDTRDSRPDADGCEAPSNSLQKVGEDAAGVEIQRYLVR